MYYSEVILIRKYWLSSWMIPFFTLILNMTHCFRCLFRFSFVNEFGKAIEMRQNRYTFYPLFFMNTTRTVSVIVLYLRSLSLVFKNLNLILKPKKLIKKSKFLNWLVHKLVWTNYVSKNQEVGSIDMLSRLRELACYHNVSSSVLLTKSNLSK